MKLKVCTKSSNGQKVVTSKGTKWSELKGLTIKDSVFPASDDKTEVEKKPSASVILTRKA